MPKDQQQSALSPEAFAAFLSWLSPNEESAAAYETARRKLVMFFAARQCRDAETLADRTLDVAIRKAGNIPADATPAGYLVGIARNVHRESLREQAKEESAHKNESRNDPEIQAEIERRHACLEQCLRTLPREERDLLLQYHAYSGRAKIETRARLAEKYRMTLNALRNRVFRLNQRLRDCVETCLQNSPA